MKRTLPIALALGAALSAAACSSSPDVSGTWTGMWTSRTGVSGQVTASFEQHGSNVDGTMAFTSSPCFNAAQLDSVLSGDNISGTATAGGIQVTISATWTEPDIDGTYDTVSAGACTGDTGTFALTREQ